MTEHVCSIKANVRAQLRWKPTMSEIPELPSTLFEMPTKKRNLSYLDLTLYSFILNDQNTLNQA